MSLFCSFSIRLIVIVSRSCFDVTSSEQSVLLTRVSELPGLDDRSESGEILLSFCQGVSWMRDLSLFAGENRPNRLAQLAPKSI